jgi:hypothetical protein
VLAFRFLTEGAIGKLSGHAWPTPRGTSPGEWVGSGIDGSSIGVGAHRARDLPHWLEDELWQVELRGKVQEYPFHLLADEARLVRQIMAWDFAAATEFAAACISRLEPRVTSAPRSADAAALAAGYLQDARANLATKQFGTVAYITFVASIDGRLGAVAEPGERELQAEWLRRRLSL